MAGLVGGGLGHTDGNAGAALPHRIERTDSEIRLRVSNAGEETARCRFLLQLLPTAGGRDPVAVDVALAIPGQTVDFIAWRVAGDVAAWRVAGGGSLACKGRERE